MIGILARIVVFTGLLMGASLASAQSVGPFSHTGSFETRAMVGVTIPLGSRSESAEAKPRFDLTIEGAQLRHGVDGFANTFSIRPERRNIRRATVSWTIENRPQFLLNGYSLQPSDHLYADEPADGEEGEDSEKNGRSTGKKILRGAAVAGGVAALAVGVGIAAIIAQCNSDEGCGE